MSTGTPLRERVSYWVRSAHATHSGHVHAPHPASTRDDPQPLCGQAGGTHRYLYDGADWMAKPTSAFPPGYPSVCKKCAARMEDS